MELLWHNGQVVMQSQNQRSVTNKKPETIRSSVADDDSRPSASGMFMQEDEMASWLHYPIDENPMENYIYDHDIIYPSVAPAATDVPVSSSRITSVAPSLLPPPPSVVIPSRPPVPPYRKPEVDSVLPKNTNFLHFTRPNKTGNPELGLVNSSRVPPGLQSATIVGSNVTPTVTPAVKVSESRISRVSEKPRGAGGTSSAGREMETCEVSMTSSPGGSGGSGASGSMEPVCQKLPALSDDRKRKSVDVDDNHCHSEVTPKHSSFTCSNF